MRCRTAFVLLPALVAAVALGRPAHAGAVAVLQNLTRPASVIELPVLGACDHALTIDESAGAVATPCPWPAPGGDWGPPLTVRPGDTLQIALGAPPAVAPQASLVTLGAQRSLVFGPGDLTPAGPDGVTWNLTLGGRADLVDAAAGGLGLALATGGGALTATLVPPRPPIVRPPLPPPLAFQSATLNRTRRTIDVRLRSSADVGVSVILTRAGTRIGRGSASLHPGTRVVAVRIGPRTFHRLSPGLHVDVRVFYGAPDPSTTLGTRLLRPLG